MYLSVFFGIINGTLLVRHNILKNEYSTKYTKKVYSGVLGVADHDSESII